MDNYEDYAEDTVTLTLEDDTEVECAIISVYEAGGKDYIALLPLGGKEESEGEVYIYRYIEDENGEPSLENIEDDAEYEMAADAFDECRSITTVILRRSFILHYCPEKMIPDTA